MESTKLLPPTETIKPSPGYTLIVRCIIQNKVGMLGKVTTAIGEAGGDIGAVDLVEFQKGKFIRDITIRARNEGRYEPNKGMVRRTHKPGQS